MSPEFGFLSALKAPTRARRNAAQATSKRAGEVVYMSEPAGPPLEEWKGSTYNDQMARQRARAVSHQNDMVDRGPRVVRSKCFINSQKTWSICLTAR